jgi:magnesium transporter
MITQVPTYCAYHLKEMIQMEDIDSNILRLEESIRDALLTASEPALLEALDGHHPADLAEVMKRLDNKDAIRVFRALDLERAAEVLDEIDQQKARYLLDNEVPERIVTLLDLLPMDDAAEVLAGAATSERQEVLLRQWTDQEDAAEVRELLSYPSGSAGRLMTEKYMRLTPEMTLDEALAAVRQADAEVETLSDLYVMEGQRLIGVLSLRDLVQAKSAQRLTDVMDRDIIAVQVDTDQEEVARLIARYDLLAIPVLHPNGTMAGIVTVDDIVDVLTEEQTEDTLKQSGIAVEPGVINAPYFSVPIWRVVKSRVGWLVLLFVAETSTGAVLRHFEEELAKVVALSFFVPLLIGTGGNTGAQTVSTIIRGIALREIRGQDTRRVLLRELTSGVLLGILLGLIAFGRAMLWGSGTQLSLVVALSILAICTWANTIGALIPLIANKFKIDPALVSAPLITTLVDATGLVIYLTIAKQLLTQLH